MSQIQILEFLHQTVGFFNLPDLVQALYGQGKKVSGFIHEGYWLDIGRTEDYQKACQDYDQRF